MPKEVEDCVRKISGTNPKTNKPYTQSEKWAICTAQHKKKNENSSLEDISIDVANATYNYATQLFNTGKAGTMLDAYEMAQIALMKNNYNYEVLELIVGK